MSDANVTAVRKKLRDRAAAGKLKYGVTTERTDLSRLDWLRHAQEEAMDLAVYLEVLIRQEQPANPHYIPTKSQLALDREVEKRKAKRAGRPA